LFREIKILVRIMLMRRFMKMVIMRRVTEEKDHDHHEKEDE
jgi:hypothetical protein